MTAERTAEFRERLAANMAKHKPLLHRLAREGDCMACVGTEHGCEQHADRGHPMTTGAFDAAGFAADVWERCGSIDDVAREAYEAGIESQAARIEELEALETARARSHRMPTEDTP
jgi:hypothetical protein